MKNSDSSAIWAVVLVFVIPLAVIAAAEVEERLRQRESMLRPAALILRTWVLPSFVVWALLVPVLGLERDTPAVRIVSSVMTLAGAVVVLRVVRVLVEDLRRRALTGHGPGAPQLLLALPRLVVVVVTGWLLVDTVWGIDLSAALTALGVTSLIVTFALQDTLSGLASGILLLSDQPFKPGDWIRSDDLEGEVIDINWRTTRIADRNGDILIVPNSQLASGTVVNFSSPTRLHRVVVELQVAFVNPPTSAKEMLLDAARGTPGVLSDPAPSVRVVQVDDPLMGYAVDMWIDDVALEPSVRSDFGSLVWYQSHRHAVPLPSPAQDLYLHDGDAASAPVSPARIREDLGGVPLLSTLPDLEMERLAHAATLSRFAAGEAIVDSRASTAEMRFLISGRARLCLVESGFPEVVVAELGPGDVMALLRDDLAEERALVVRALSDCEVIGVEAETAAEISSRHTEVAEVLNRLATMRRRRVERILGRRADTSEVDEGEGTQP